VVVNHVYIIVGFYIFGFMCVCVCVLWSTKRILNVRRQQM